MRTVYKYILTPDTEIRLDLPDDAQIVHVDSRSTGQLWMWVLLDPIEPARQRILTVHGTGHPVSDDEEHVHTWIEGFFVWHLFMKMPECASERGVS